MHYTTIDTRFDPAGGPVEINSFNGSAQDQDSRIWPFKRMHTVQPYDKGNNTLVYMHLWGDDENAYWGNYDFASAIAAGMQKHGLPYSGQHGFVDTYSYWPITHMVAPAEDALACGSCHADKGRLQDIDGVYVPGRNETPWLDKAMLWILAATLFGILGHALVRFLFGRNTNDRGEH